jgi:AraC family ethanolamine operon transcriptional activator
MGRRTRPSIGIPQKSSIRRQRIEGAQRASSPAVTVVEISDPTAGEEGLEVLSQDLLQLEKRPLRARRLIVRLEGSLVLFHSTNLRVRTRTTVHNQLLAYVVIGPEARGTVNGLPLRSDLMLAVEPGTQVEFVVEAGYKSVTVLVRPAVLESHWIGRKREGHSRVPRGMEALDVDAVHASGLFDWGERLANTAARQPTLFNGQEETLAAAQIELLEMLLAALDTTTVPQHTRSDQTRQAHSRVVRLAEDYALAHASDRLYVTDLCVATGLSERTLQYAFQEVMGMSPLAFLTRLRLHRVRQALRMATQGSTTVSAEALNWGFWHFGDFSRAYRDLFGELPSETLRRPAAGTRR